MPPAGVSTSTTGGRVGASAGALAAWRIPRAAAAPGDNSPSGLLLAEDGSEPSDGDRSTCAAAPPSPAPRGGSVMDMRAPAAGPEALGCNPRSMSTHTSHTRCTSREPSSRMRLGLHSSHTVRPHTRQWCARRNRENGLLQRTHLEVSGAHTCAICRVWAGG